MHKILAIVLCLAALAIADNTPCCDGDAACQDFVCQPCSDPKECPECFHDPTIPNPPPEYHEPCCQQLSHVIALTAASVQAAVNAYAGALATTQAATRVQVSSVAAASVSAYVSLVQSLSLSVNTGRCCEIAQDIAGNATSYSSSASASAASAQAAAIATASAASAAQSAAEAAASFYDEAESLITSTCCGFNLEVLSAVFAAGNYVVSAQGAVTAAVAVATAAQDAAYAVASAASVSTATSQTILKAKLDNCCVNNFTAAYAGQTASTCLNVCNKAEELHGVISDAFQYFASFAKDFSNLTDSITLVDAVAASECGDVTLSCCECPPDNPSCCNDSLFSVQLASYAIADVYQSVNVVVENFAQALSYATSRAAVYATAIANAYTAARAASYAAASIGVSVSNCCSITVTISTQAVSSAKSIGTSLASSNAIAQAYAYSYSTTDALSKAIAHATASAASVVTAYYNGCCGTSCCKLVSYLNFAAPRLGCCDVSQRVVQAYSNEYLSLVSTALQSEAAESKSQSTATTSSGASDCTQLIRRASTRSGFLLQCCCCTTKNAVASTVKIGYASTRKLSGLLF